MSPRWGFMHFSDVFLLRCRPAGAFGISFLEYKKSLLEEIYNSKPLRGVILIEQTGVGCKAQARRYPNRKKALGYKAPAGRHLNRKKSCRI
jgi:hypothetical protein